MRTRNQLHVSKLTEFIEWCESQGWQQQTPKGEWEVAILTKKGFDRAIIHKRVSNNSGKPLEHLTLHGNSQALFKKWKDV